MSDPNYPDLPAMRRRETEKKRCRAYAKKVLRWYQRYLKRKERLKNGVS